jgi:hypothetical protein
MKDGRNMPLKEPSKDLWLRFARALVARLEIMHYLLFKVHDFMVMELRDSNSSD